MLATFPDLKPKVLLEESDRAFEKTRAMLLGFDVRTMACWIQ